MKRNLGVVALMLALGSASCVEDHPAALGNEPNPASAAQTGTIAMKLTGVDETGKTFWLRGAEFVIDPVSSGGVARTVSSDTDPNADAVSVVLPTGDYSVTLRGDWYLELQTAQGNQRLDATLASPPTAQVTVSANTRTEIAFRFAIDRLGELVIGIEIVYVDRDAGPPGASDGGVDAGVGGLDGGIDGGIRPVTDAAIVLDASIPTPDAALVDDGGEEEPEPTPTVDGGQFDAATTVP